jgi:microcystin-dependent protein
MPFDWSEYESDSGTEEVPLLLSVKSQSLILAAMQSLQFRSNWLEVDDSDWDEIDAAVAEAYEEIMRSVMPDFSPVGMVAWFMSLQAQLPEKWLICDGTTYLQVDYPDLYSTFVGTAYRLSGTQFKVPDLRSRFLYGNGLDATLDNKAGDVSHVLTTSEMPAHTHIQRGRNVTGGANNQSAIAVGTDTTQLTTITTTGSTGNGDAHNNMPPYIRGYFCIKALP